jgi:hypothetical protein
MSARYYSLEAPCTINVDKTIVHPLFGDNNISGSSLILQHIFAWLNLILLFIFTPAFVFVGYQGYKLNKEVTFEVAVMIIAVIYNGTVGVAQYIYCDDFMVISCEVTSSGILLYMFFRFQ